MAVIKKNVLYVCFFLIILSSIYYIHNSVIDFDNDQSLIVDFLKNNESIYDVVGAYRESKVLRRVDFSGDGKTPRYKEYRIYVEGDKSDARVKLKITYFNNEKSVHVEKLY